MGRFYCESSDPWPCSFEDEPEDETSETVLENEEQDGDEEIQEVWAEIDNGGDHSDGGAFLAGDRRKKMTKKKSQVLLEGYVEATAADDQDDLKRSKSLTDDDLEELKGCLDLGFGFSYDEIPELCNTLPALELCYSMSQKFLDEKQNQLKSPESSPVAESPPPPPATASPIANWKISSPVVRAFVLESFTNWSAFAEMIAYLGDATKSIEEKWEERRGDTHRILMFDAPPDNYGSIDLKTYINL